MKKVLLTLLAVLVVAGVLAGTGFAGYRIGYRQGTLTTSDGSNVPFVHPFQMSPRDMPMHNFGRDLDRSFDRNFGPQGFGMRGGMGFFAPLMFLGRILFWGLVIWFVYWLFTRSGWQLTRKPQPVSQPVVESPRAETTAETSSSEEKEA